MRKLNKKRISLGITAAILLLALAFYAWYTKPVTLSELYPMLELDKCTQIQGYYEIGTQAEPSEFTSPKTAENLKRCTICSMNSAIAAASEMCFPAAPESIGQSRMIFNGMSILSLSM